MALIKRYRFPLAAAGLAVLATAPQTAAASDASVGFRLSATVEPFCRIQSEAQETTALSLTDGAVDLGLVREVCNTRGGYSISVELMNVVSGDLEYGDGVSPVDAMGKAKVVSAMARSKTSNWRLRNAALGTAGAPVFMRVSISPL